MPAPIRMTTGAVDFSTRYGQSKTVVASPAAAAETIIASLTLTQDVTVATGIQVSGWAAFTVGTNGTAVQLRIRQTNVAGTVIVASGALTGGVAAAGLLAQDVEVFDTAAVLPNQVYVRTLQV